MFKAEKACAAKIDLYLSAVVNKMGRGNNADRPYDDRGEGITSTQKVGNFFCCNLIWEGPKLPTK